MIRLPSADEFPALSPEEEKLSMAKYYHRPLVPLDPVFERAVEAGPLKAEEIPLPENWWELARAEGYNDSDFGYGELEEGAGYVATYTVSRFAPERRGWWFRWMQVAPKSMPEGKGNLCYKLWFPPDHFDHTPEFGHESLDLGKGDPKEKIFNHFFDPVEMGMPADRYNELRARGVDIQIGYETFDHAGSHLTFRYSRPCETGGYEYFGREWFGYGIRNGTIFRDRETPVQFASTEYAKKVLIHCTAEMLRLETILEEVYEEYHDQPLDAD